MPSTVENREELLRQTGQGLFFIVGSGRCGSTLLRAMFDAHPELASPSETHFYTYFESEYRKRFENPSERETALAKMMEDPRIKALEVSSERVLELVGDGDWDALFLAFMTAFRENRGASRAGEKTPRHLLRWEYLAKAFPHCRFVHLVRDPRAVVASYLGARFYTNTNGRNPYRALRKWLRIMRAHGQASKTLGNDRYTVVRYEDLVADPESELRRLCAFLDIPFDERMLDYQNRAKTGYVQDKTNREGIKREVYQSSVEKWRSKLRKADVRAIDAMCGEAMRSLGYQPDSTGESAATKLYISWLALRMNARESLRNIGSKAGLSRRQFGMKAAIDED